MNQAKSKTSTPPVAPAINPEAAPEPANVSQPQKQPARQAANIEVSDAYVHGSYANFCRVTGTPEELIVDYGLNPQPMNAQSDPIRVDGRIVMNYFTAKRLLHALNMSIQRHESVFGVLETDIQKRVQRPAAMPKPAEQPKK